MGCNPAHLTCLIPGSNSNPVRVQIYLNDGHHPSIPFLHLHDDDLSNCPNDEETGCYEDLSSR